MQSAYCSRFPKFNNYVFLTTTLRKSILMWLSIFPEVLNRCNLLIAVASKKSRICKKKYLFLTTTLRKSILMCFLFSPEDVNRCNLLIAAASKKSRICTKKISFSNYYFEEIKFNVFFYFPRRTSIGAICLLQSFQKIKNLYKKCFCNYYFEEINFNVFFYFPGGRQ